MTNKTFLIFLQELAGKDKLEVSFTLMEYMQWAGIPFEDLESVSIDVHRTLRKLMNYKKTFEDTLLFLQRITVARVVPSFTTIGIMFAVEFAEWTREVRQEEDWLLKIVEKMEKKNEHSRIY